MSAPPELDAFLQGIPAGGLFSPDSVIWKISRERVILIGGPAAAILQVAHPSVGLGVARHSNFREDAVGRLLRTVRSIYAITFGDREEIQSFANRIAMMHQMVRNTGADVPYSAFDPALQLWVTATLIVPAVTLFESLVGPLTPAEKDTYFQEMRQWSQVFGLPLNFGPQSWEYLNLYYRNMIEGDLLGSDPICAEVVKNIIGPEKPFWLGAASRRLDFLVTELIPSPLRERLGLQSAPWKRTAWAGTQKIISHFHPYLPAVLRHPPQYRTRVAALSR